MSNNVLSQVDAVLSNPIVHTGLRIASPEAVLALDAVRAIAGGLFAKRQHAASEIMNVVDQRLALYIQELSKKETSRSRQKELEVRIHELLGVLDAWDEVS